MGSNKYPRGLPPQYPARRGSNTPISPLASHQTPPAPNRSRSLDGLLDSEPTVAAKSATSIERIPSNASRSCEEMDKENVCQSQTETSDGPQSDTENVNDPNDTDKVSIISNSSDKRKRNFMDRCVNKVRSFIKK